MDPFGNFQRKVTGLGLMVRRRFPFFGSDVTVATSMNCEPPLRLFFRGENVGNLVTVTTSLRQTKLPGP